MSPDSSSDDGADRSDPQVPGGRSLTEGLQEDLRTYPWNRGVGYALGALLAVTLGVTGLLAVGGFGSGPLVGQLQLVLIIVFAAHNVGFLVDDPGGMWFLGGEPSRNPIEVIRLQTQQSGAAPDVPLDLYYLVPVVVLLLVGFAFAYRQFDAENPPTIVESVEYGVSVAVPYALVMVLLVPALGRGTNFGNVKGPSLLGSGLFGLAYPGVLVTVGAALAIAVRLATTGDAAGESGQTG